MTTTVTTELSARHPGWEGTALASLRTNGFAIVHDVLPARRLELIRAAMYAVQERILADIGPGRLDRAGELGVLRLMLAYDESFSELLELDAVLAVVDATVSATAIMHLQNGLILPPSVASGRGQHFQTTFHRDFPRHLEGYVASVNTFLAIDEFTERNGATLLVPGSHQRPEAPTDEQMQATAIPALCPAGSMIAFDSTLWHAAGENRSDRDRLGINQQFTRSFVKQQIDYVRALGDAAVLRQQPRTQQLLGWYTRVVTSLDEYYRPADERLYRGGQG
jgi:ectoine hydroxylase-related dioxygenase (phytanoyl-CoA dioxygenase family)